MKSPNKELCSWKEPLQVAKELTKEWGTEGLIWLDGDNSKLGKWITIGVDPIEQISCHGLPNNKDAKNPFQILRGLNKGHWTGWLSYEASAWLEPSNPWKEDQMSTLWIASHDPILKFDLEKKQLWVEGYNRKRLEIIKNFITNIPEEITSFDYSKNKEFSIEVPSWKWLTKKEEFSCQVKKVKELIREGDLFQANLSACCIAKLPASNCEIDLFQKLRIYSPAPFSGLVIGAGEAKSEAIISASPERFLKVLTNGTVETRPIKGTRPRHINSIKDVEIAIDLVCSPKDRAENIMIVDLIRNDLGRVCCPGTIHVPQLAGLESYKHVHHLTSVVKGTLRDNKTWVDLLEASWPGGSISGTPKLRACQRLHELEPIARGPYCGSLIKVNWDGSFDSNILIRSLIVQQSSIRAHAGCGIVADSDPYNETEELGWKLIPLLKALE